MYQISEAEDQAYRRIQLLGNVSSLDKAEKGKEKKFTYSVAYLKLVNFYVFPHLP